MSDDIEDAPIFDQYKHLIKRDAACAFEELIFLIAPVEFTHIKNLPSRVPFVNTLEAGSC